MSLAPQQSSDFTASWNTRQLVINTANEVNVTLPEATANDIGKVISFIVSSDPENFNIIIHASDLSGVINTIPSEDDDKAKARISSFRKQFWAFNVLCVSENNYILEEPDSVYNSLLYRMFVNNTSSSVHNALNMSAVIPNFLTRNASWWFAIKYRGTPYKFIKW